MATGLVGALVVAVTLVGIHPIMIANRDLSQGQARERYQSYRQKRTRGRPKALTMPPHHLFLQNVHGPSRRDYVPVMRGGEAAPPLVKKGVGRSASQVPRCTRLHWFCQQRSAHAPTFVAAGMWKEIDKVAVEKTH